MPSLHHDTARTLAEKLLDYPESEWNSLIDKWCDGNSELKQELIRQSETNRNARDFVEELQKRVYSLAKSTFETGLETPAEIEGYKIIRTLGTGGSAVVYLAEDENGRKLALKLLRSTNVDSLFRQRFDSERFILSKLDHPNIARLVDCDITEHGVPYVIMEYIDGVPIDIWCRENRLSIPDKVQLFCQVCEAVHYAHQNLLVHRDLKPEHVLITSSGDIKLIDFGIAKLLDPVQAGFPAFQTQTGIRVMTPEFASPEQVRGHQVTTASDIYSLGVLLYLLLTGRHPYRFKTTSLLEIERVVCEHDPIKPSDAVILHDSEHPVHEDEAGHPFHSGIVENDPDGLRKVLRGDLDRIIQMAMNKEPSMRYASAQSFADDLTNYLRGDPVSARPPTLHYRVKKFISRHKVTVSAAMFAIFSLTVGLFGTIWQARQAQLNAERAEIQAERAEQVSAFLIDLFEESDPTKANDGSITAREMLDQGFEKVQTELEGQPAVQAQMLGMIGKVYQNLGFYDQAHIALEKAVNSYRNIGETSAGFMTVLLKLANLEYRLGQLDKAATSASEVLELKTKLYGPDHPEVASVLNTLALVYEGKEDYVQAIEMLRRVVDIRRQQPEPGSNLAANLNNLAILLQQVGELEESGLLFREALEVVEDIWGDRHPFIAYTLNGYAGLHQSRGLYDLAETNLLRALDIGRSVFPDTHPFIAVVRHNLGKLYEETGDFTKAAENFEAGLDLRRTSLPPGHADIASSLDGLGQVLIELDKPAEAEVLLREALDIRKEAYPEDDWRIAQVEAHLGRSLLRQNRLAEAEPYLRKSYEALLLARGEDDIHTRRVLADLAGFQSDSPGESE